MTNTKKFLIASRKDFKKSLLALSIISLSAPLMAQVEVAEDPALDEIIVTGMKSSIDSAQNIKRNADTVKDVITASDIGALPDKSVTEALQRVAGVTVERFADTSDPNHFADEGSGVLIRGLDRVRSEINGRDSFSANPNGGLNFEDISPELLGSVEVVKNQTADLIAGGIAGTVNLVTRKPFDATDRIIMLSTKASYGDFREEISPSYSGLFSDRWETGVGEFGALLSASFTEFKSRGDGIGVANYYSRGDAYIPSAGDGDIAAPNSPLEGRALQGQAPGTIVYMPGQFSLRTANNDRERTGIAGSLQWQNVDESIITTLEYIKSDASLIWRERVIGAQVQGFDGPLPNYLDLVDNSPRTLDSGFFTSGRVKGTNNHTNISSRYNDANDVVEDVSFNVSLLPTDVLKINIDYQHIESTQQVKNYGVNGHARNTISDADVDLRGSKPKITYIDPRFTQANATYNSTNKALYLASALDQNIDSDGTADAIALDIEYGLDSDWFKNIKSGIYYTDKDLTIRDTEYSNWGALNRAWIGGEGDASSPDVVPDEWEQVDFGDFYKNGGLVGGNTNFYFPKMSNAENFTEFTRRGCGTFSRAPYGGGDENSYPQTNSKCYMSQMDLPNRIAGTPFAPFHVTSTNEERTEAYVRVDFGNDELAMPMRGNLGLRYVNYQLESTGFTLLPTSRPTFSSVAGETFFNQKYPGLLQMVNPNGGISSTIKGTNYSTLLPSFNLAVDVADDVIARVGVSKGLFFPALNLTRNSRVASVSVTESRQISNKPLQENPNLPNYNPVIGVTAELSGNQRNPFLEPEEAVNFDVSAEWYFAEAGSLTASLFRKDVDNLFRDRTVPVEVVNPRNGAKEKFSLTGPVNDGSGSIQGFEMAYSQFYDFLPGAFSGLGLQLNYTYVDQKDMNDDAATGTGGVRFNADGTELSDARATFRQFTNLPLPGYSDQNYNIVGMYEYNDISARLAYTWRSEYLITRRDSNEFAPVYSKDVGSLDFTFFYNINDNFKIGFEATNLLDTETETQVQLNQSGDRTDSLNFITDKRYAISLRANF